MPHFCLFNLKKLFLALFLVLFLFQFISSCQQKPKLTGFDEETWRKDVRGCGNKRKEMVTTLEKVKPALIGLRHNYIIEILGKPEGNSLEKSGQRKYYYFLEPGPHCQDKQNIKDSEKVFIQFDALDRAQYITFGK